MVVHSLVLVDLFVVFVDLAGSYLVQAVVLGTVDNLAPDTLAVDSLVVALVADIDLEHMYRFASLLAFRECEILVRSM